MGLTVPQAELLSAGIGFLGNIGGSVAGGAYSNEQAAANRKFQKEMYERQVEDTLKFWDMQNKYNLPSAVYAREIEGLKANNLNPYLMYSNGAPTGNLAEQPDLPSAPHGAQGQVSSFNTQIELANLALVQAQADNLRADSEQKRKQAAKFETETEDIGFDLAFKRDVRDVRVAQEAAQYDLTKSMEALNREQRYYFRDQCKVLGAQVDSIISDMNNKKAMNATQIKDINTRLDKFLEEFPHVIANLDSQTRKNYADALAATVAARYQKELLDSGYIDILVGKEAQDFLNAIKYGDALTIENGLKALEFQSRPASGSWMYDARNFMEYVGKPAVEILEDAAIGAGGFMMLKGGFKKMPKIGFKP